VALMKQAWLNIAQQGVRTWRHAGPNKVPAGQLVREQDCIWYLDQTEQDA
jgi:hypothetical protein